MGVYIKNWSLADWKELLKWAKIGANNAMIGEFIEVEEVQPHGRCVDADEFDERIRQAGGMCEEELTKDFKDGVQTVLAMLKTQTTIIPAEEGET